MFLLWFFTALTGSAQQKKFVFTGILERTEAVEDILMFIEATSDGQLQFEINDKTIIIK